MDQDSFRKLLDSGSAGSTSGPGTSRGSLLAAAKPYVAKKIDASQPAFKPRKVKEKDSKYRDRASERRHGEGNDFAHVEALLEDFEKQTKDAKSLDEIEEKRKYLGGDGDHSVLVKGLDFALLEQNKARAAIVTDALDDDALEQTFQDVVASTDKPSTTKKRSRADLLRELKEKRAGGGAGEDTKLSAEEEARRLEEAKQQGKFKPIGFKPIGQPEGEGKKKKKKVKGEDGERKKKKRKVATDSTAEGTKDTSKEPEPAHPSKSDAPTSKPTAPPAPAEPEPADDDFDIFADAGEYDGLGLGDDDDDDDEAAVNTSRKARIDSPSKDDEEEGEFVPKQWIPMEDTGPILRRVESKSPPPPTRSAEGAASNPSRRSAGPDEVDPRRMDVDSEDEEPMRLVPLASSALPDIKELLEADRQATSSWKNKKRKEKKKAEKGEDDASAPKISAEQRAERDYKRLQAYQEKKKGGK